METGELIRMYRTRRGMTQQELAEKVGYKHKTAISKIEMGEVDLPQSKIQQFADIFGIRPSVLIEGEITNNQKKNRPSHRIPVFGSIAAGVPIEEIEDIDDWVSIDYPGAAASDYLALRVKGNSMFPLICDGDIIIIRIQPTIENGELAAVRVNDDTTGGVDATCKRVKFADDGGILLLPQNPECQAMYYSRKDIKEKGVEVIGKVVELRRML